MTSTVTNQSHAIVSFRGNSGETWHIPPGHAITIMTIELTDNEKVANENWGSLPSTYGA
jgi:hypothetical protein